MSTPIGNFSLTPGANDHLEVDTIIKAAITRLQEIDENLDGGSTGKVLKKASGTDYDYAWGDEQDVTGKADKTQLLVESISAAGPTSYTTETTMLTLVPSATQSSAKMRYTFMGYLSNNAVDTATIRIRRAGTQIAITKTTVPIGQINFCLTWIASYTANQSITATVEYTADGGDANSYILICESLDAI